MQGHLQELRNDPEILRRSRLVTQQPKTDNSKPNAAVIDGSYE